MSHIHDRIRAVVAQAEARINKTRIRKLAAEQNRHDSRKAEIHREADTELEVARAALKGLPVADAEFPEVDEQPASADPQPTSFRAAVAAVADALPEEELPKGAATPYEPTQRLTGKARAR